MRHKYTIKMTGAGAQAICCCGWRSESTANPGMAGALFDRHCLAPEPLLSSDGQNNLPGMWRVAFRMKGTDEVVQSCSGEGAAYYFATALVVDDRHRILEDLRVEEEVHGRWMMRKSYIE